jgi:HSP20 family molecular chaperone IbpA
MQAVSNKKVVNVKLNENKESKETREVRNNSKQVSRLEQEVVLLKKRMNNPKVDLVERGDKYYVRMETSGDIEDINIELNESQVLIVSFNKPYPEKDENERAIYRECRYGRFMRRVKLPTKVKMISKDDLVYNNGVLNLEFIKKEDE